MIVEFRKDGIWLTAVTDEEKKNVKSFLFGHGPINNDLRVVYPIHEYPTGEIVGFQFNWTERTMPDPFLMWKENNFANLGNSIKPKMKMLFLDDREKRTGAARERFGGKWDLTIVSNAKECLRKLSAEDWDEVRMDHDLDGDDFQDPDSPTAGMEVVRYITKCGWPPNKKKPIFRVHSSNIFASWLMVRTLQAAGFIAVWERFEYKDGIQCGS